MQRFGLKLIKAVILSTSIMSRRSGESSYSDREDKKKN